MTAVTAVVVALLLAALLVAAFNKPARTAVTGLIYRDKKGRLVLVLTPARRGKGRRR